MANDIARWPHGPQKCDYNVQYLYHKFSGASNDKMAMTIEYEHGTDNTNDHCVRCKCTKQP